MRIPAILDPFKLFFRLLILGLKITGYTIACGVQSLWYVGTGTRNWLETLLAIGGAMSQTRSVKCSRPNELRSALFELQELVW